MVGVASAVALARKDREAMMRSMCVITRAGEPVFNPDTGEYDQSIVTIYDGKCRVKPSSSFSDVEAAETQVTLRRFMFELPLSFQDPVNNGDKIVITSAEDAWWASLEFTVITYEVGTDRVIRRVLAERVNRE